MKSKLSFYFKILFFLIFSFQSMAVTTKSTTTKRTTTKTTTKATTTKSTTQKKKQKEAPSWNIAYYGNHPKIAAAIAAVAGITVFGALFKKLTAMFFQNNQNLPDSQRNFRGGNLPFAPQAPRRAVILERQGAQSGLNMGAFTSDSDQEEEPFLRHVIGPNVLNGLNVEGLVQDAFREGITRSQLQNRLNEVLEEVERRRSENTASRLNESDINLALMMRRVQAIKNVRIAAHESQMKTNSRSFRYLHLLRELVKNRSRGGRVLLLGPTWNEAGAPLVHELAGVVEPESMVVAVASQEVVSTIGSSVYDYQQAVELLTLLVLDDEDYAGSGSLFAQIPQHLNDSNINVTSDALETVVSEEDSFDLIVAVNLFLFLEQKSFRTVRIDEQGRYQVDDTELKKAIFLKLLRALKKGGTLYINNSTLNILQKLLGPNFLKEGYSLSRIKGPVQLGDIMAIKRL